MKNRINPYLFVIPMFLAMPAFADEVLVAELAPANSRGEYNKVVRVLTMEDSGKGVEAEVGDVIRVDLWSQGGTGYLWHPEELDAAHVRLVGKRSVSSAEQGVTGAPVLRMYYFEATAAGRSELKMLFYRPWEGKDRTVKSFRVPINISDKG